MRVFAPAPVTQTVLMKLAFKWDDGKKRDRTPSLAHARYHERSYADRARMTTLPSLPQSTPLPVPRRIAAEKTFRASSSLSVFC